MKIGYAHWGNPQKNVTGRGGGEEKGERRFRHHQNNRAAPGNG